jgi:hypothetical protein
MPNDPNEQGREYRRAEDDPERRRHSHELPGKKFEIAFARRSGEGFGLSQL